MLGVASQRTLIVTSSILLIEMSSVYLDKVLGYLVRFFGNIIRFAIPVPSQNIPEAGSGTDVSNSLFGYVRAVGAVMAFIGACLRVCFLVFWTLCFCGSVIIAMAPRRGA